MPQLAERQRGFAAALLDAALPVPTGLVGPDGKASAKRFAVYRNNVVVGLTETLKAAFPAVHRIVGAEFFHTMARTYAVVEPPRSPILLLYGAGFPEFIGQFGPAAVLPYLADVARIERTWTEAYHAPEASPIDPTDLEALAPEEFSAVRFQLHPSARLVRSQFPALTIWRMNVADGVPEPVDLAAGGEDVLVVRPAADVEARSIPGGAFEFVQALAAGATVLTAMKAALAADHRFDLSANLAGLMRAGALVGYDMEQATGASEIKRLA